MRRTQKDWAVDELENFKDGTGITKIQRFLNPDEFYGKGRMFAQFSLEPGASIGVHTHEGEQEVYFITQGAGEYSDNGEIYAANVGDVLICKDGGAHGIKNNGSETLKYIALITFTK